MTQERTVQTGIPEQYHKDSDTLLRSLKEESLEIVGARFTIGRTAFLLPKQPCQNTERTTVVKLRSQNELRLLKL